MLLYAATIFLSAFLLFEVQPIIAKMILPWFGGSAAVWTTALMFFQITLLAGYVYAYVTTRYLKPRSQAVLHVSLLAVSLLLLPIVPSAAWRTASDGDPTLRIVLLLTAAVGLPYFMLSTTGPLLQAWYAASRPASAPYRLYAVSNAGSMLALISFPLAVEPFLRGSVQANIWSAAYAAFVIAASAIAVGASKHAQAPTLDTLDEPPSRTTQIYWIALPACASALLLAITNHLSQNVAPIPFLWVLTLAIYLATFILCFESDRSYRRPLFIPLLAIALAGMSFGLYYQYGNLGIYWALPLYAGGLFVCCMVCHGELSLLRPTPRYLTKFYLMLALGGALGGLFVAVIAPRIFHSYAELPIAMVLCAALAVSLLWTHMPRQEARITAAALVLALAGYLGINEFIDEHRYLAAERNFYGLLRVTTELETGEHTQMIKLMNGTILHGQQLSDPKRRDESTSYYGPKSGVGRVIKLLQQKQHLRVGVIGLGAGVIASYCRPGDTFRYYEINPLDIALANRYFTFLRDCPGDCKVLQGDARLTLERQSPQQFDLLAVDAFTSDSIPIHLLTREAFALYFRHIAPHGILAVHVTNRYLNLVPIVARNGDELQRPAYQMMDDGKDADYLAATDWMLVGPDTHMFVLLGFQGASIIRRGAPKTLRTWTDDFSNLYEVLK
jgi:hypothetical protein